MKIWNASASKFYSETMNALASFFGLNADETTEAELHQQLIEAGSLAQIKASAIAEANEAVQAQMADFQSQLAALQTDFATLKTDADAKAEKVLELETALETVRGEVAGKDDTIAGHLQEIKTLSGTVATLRAAKTTDKDTPPDDSKPGIPDTRQLGGKTVSMDEVQAAYKRAVGLN